LASGASIFPPKLGRHNRAAGFPSDGCYSDAAKERMQRNLDRELGVQSLECRCVCCLIDRIEPDLFGQRRVQHGSVAALVQRAEARPQHSRTLVPVYLEIEKLDS